MTVKGFKGALMAIRMYPKPWPVFYGYYGIAYPLVILSIAHIPVAFSNILSVLFIVFCLMSITFSLNYISDMNGDALKEDKGNNPIVLGYISPRNVYYIALAFGVLLTIYIVLYPHPVYIIFTVIGLFLGITYSFGLRWKETPGGIFIASLFFIGPCMMLFALTYSTYGYVPLYFLFYVSFLMIFALYFEIDHTLYDYWHDLRAGFKTFSVIYGLNFTAKVHMVLGTFVIAFSVFLSYYFNIYALIIVIFTLILYITKKYDIRLILVPHAIFFLQMIGGINAIVIAILSIPIMALFFYYITHAIIYYIVKMRNAIVTKTANAKSKTSAVLRDTIYKEFYLR